MKKNRRRLLIDICHPGEVHHFKHIYWELSKRGWEVLFAAKRKDVVEELLLAYDLPHVIFSASRKGLVRKLAQLPLELWRFARIVHRFRPTFLFSNLSLHASWISLLFPLTHIAFIDTEHRRLLDYVTLPFAHVKLTPRAYKRHLGRNHIRYAGNHETTYLHPKRFRPDPAVRNRLNVAADERYVILRFVSWQAFHDVGHQGLDMAKKLLLLQKLSAYKVFISSEAALPPALAPFELPLPKDQIHAALAFADAYIGEGATMASEAACLGTPAIYLNSLRMGYIDEEREYGLLHQFDSLDARALLSVDTLRKTAEHRKRSEQFWSAQIDVTDFIVQLLNTFPRCLYQK